MVLLMRLLRGFSVFAVLLTNLIVLIVVKVVWAEVVADV